MTPDEKIYTLIAHAEDIQKAARQLQTRASVELEKMPETLSRSLADVGKQVRRQTLVGSASVIGAGIVTAAIVYVFLAWSTSSLRTERANLQSELVGLQGAAADIRAQTGGAMRVDVTDIGNALAFPPDTRFVKLADGRTAAVIKSR